MTAGVSWCWHCFACSDPFIACYAMCLIGQARYMKKDFEELKVKLTA